ncbi:hypothetical protein CRYUN_Cryun09bG0117300 [Craigia yunnanensis]
MEHIHDYISRHYYANNETYVLWHIQPVSISVIKGIIEEIENGNVDSIFHVGDISYATGFLVEWEFFLHLLSPLASQVAYMTVVGNHERDYADSGSRYPGPDSGGECGVPYKTYFPMPTPAKDKPWHRPMYCSLGADDKFLKFVEPLLLDNKVDLVLVGHVHNYERTCSVYNSECLAMPTKDDNSNNTAPVQAIVGMAGFSLDNFPDDAASWSLSRISEFGYVRAHATKDELKLEFVNSDTKDIEDSFRITKNQSS